MKLVKVEIFKYKCFKKEQEVEINDKITPIVGMNESGKTSFLSALAKSNYFDERDTDFRFDITHDYPRNELIDFECDERAPGSIISCTYEITDELIAKINQSLGCNVFEAKQFKINSNYRNPTTTVAGLKANDAKFAEHLAKKYQLSAETRNKLKQIKSIEAVLAIKPLTTDADFQLFIDEVKLYANNPKGWNDLARHIYASYIKPIMPKFWYFDDYYPLGAKINISRAATKKAANEREKTAKALFDLAKINPADVLNAPETHYERFVAMLEAAGNKITNEIFKYWTANTNLEIDFKIQDIRNSKGGTERYLDIRVKSIRHKITLPLDRRSKGFNWFFSFIVWFSRIQSEKQANYILLLDEPGLNLHASVQQDLLTFINKLADKYQVIYTTHSPFMVDSSQLAKVKTCNETDEGSVISSALTEQDSKTLYPLQAALGYQMCQQMLPPSPVNLLVDGPTHLLLLQMMSQLLKQRQREGLRDDITIVPIGGAKNLAALLALADKQPCRQICLFDSITDATGIAVTGSLIANDVLADTQIMFYESFVSAQQQMATIEDLFPIKDYLTHFNQVLGTDFGYLKVSQLDNKLDAHIHRIGRKINNAHFDRYKVAHSMFLQNLNKVEVSEATLKIFERIFNQVNCLANG